MCPTNWRLKYSELFSQLRNIKVDHSVTMWGSFFRIGVMPLWLNSRGGGYQEDKINTGKGKFPPGLHFISLEAAW